jgi:NAD(P)H-hydrate repair Nnr-like enzyme with NAD(P)H-hydrate epimerase domain
VITQGESDEHVAVIVEGSAAVVLAVDVPSDVRAQARGEWAGTWVRVRVRAERVISYVSEGAL